MLIILILVFVLSFFLINWSFQWLGNKISPFLVDKKTYEIIKGLEIREGLLDKVKNEINGHQNLKKSIIMWCGISSVIYIFLRNIFVSIIAGLQSKITLLDVQNIKILFSLMGLSYFSLLYLITMDATMIFLGISGTLLLYYVPNYYVVMRGKKRQDKISRELPSVLTTLAIITDAGLNLVPAIETLVTQSTGTLIDELGRALEEIHIGISQKEAFTRVSNRCQVDEVRYFVSALLQGIERGSNGLTMIIRQQADESWQKRKYDAKTMAEKASMKLFLPLLCMVFPAVAIYLIGPMVFSLIKLFEII